jgi:hypothetical protein
MASKGRLTHMKVKGVDPLAIIQINDTYILGIYKGTLSNYDLLLRYRQKTNNEWSRIRTPKHIHWAVDAILKMHYNSDETKKFLTYLIDLWDNQIKPLTTDEERNILLDIEKLKEEANNEAQKYQGLAGKGEYSIKFLYLLAKLLMIQEKTNLSTAYMFKNLLKALKEHKDIYKIVATATHNRR